MSPAPEAPPRSARDTARNVLALAIILAILGGGVWLVWALSRYGDPIAEPGLPIDNRTGSELLIYSVVRDDSRVTDELLRAEIAAHRKQDSGIECAAGEQVARTADGTEIARRNGQGQCFEEPWVIQPPP